MVIFNASSIELRVLFDSKEKAQQFIKKFTEGYKQDMSFFSETIKSRLNSSDSIKNYYGLKTIYESIIIPEVEKRMREKIEDRNPGLSSTEINLIFNKEKENNIEFLRKNLELTRVSAAFNVIKPDDELESSLPSGFGLGKATCGTCGKVKGDEEKGWKLGEWKARGIPKTFFCSQNCFDKFDWGNYDPQPDDSSPKIKTCHFCQQQYQQGTGVYFPDNPGMDFCSKKCARGWEKEFWDKKDLANQRVNFIAASLEKLPGWNLLSEEEKENLIKQVNNSEPKQFGNIYQQVKKLIREKQKPESEQTSGEGSEGDSSSDNDNSDDNSESGSSSDSTNNSEGESDNQLSEKFKQIAQLPLPQARTKAEQEIEKLLKENGISYQELNKEKLLEGTDWKSYLKKLDSPQKVAEFTEKLQQVILAIKLARSAQNGDKNPKNGWILPAVILVISFLALTSLILIIRKRRQRIF